MPKHFAFLFLLIPFFGFAQFEGPRPTWVKLEDAPAPQESWREDGMQFLAYDHQYNIAEEESFYRYTYHLESPEAVTSNSDISVSYFPSYRKLTFHNIFVIRNGARIDLLKDHQADLVRNESNRGNLIYDSSVAMIYHLKDIRPGDILQYEFSRKGTNPAFGEHYYSSESLQRYIPIGYLNYRILVPDGEDPKLIFSGPEEVEPARNRNANFEEWKWELRDIPAAEYEGGEPYNFDPRNGVSISNYRSWADLEKEALSLYELSDLDKTEIKKAAEGIIGSEKNLEKQLLLLSRFVQDQVRYLGFEQGVHAFKPHNPLEVLSQRFGDCKDKSMALVELMRSLGVEAYPMWVSSYKQARLADDEVSPYVFDHCVMLAILGKDTIYIDPTTSSVGGTFKSQSFPNYGKGFILKKGQTGLSRLPLRLKGRVEIEDNYGVAVNNSGSSTLRVHTTYYGDEADGIRAYLTNNSAEVISEDYVDYYRRLWPSIRVDKLPEIKDDLLANTIEVFEYYSIDSLWELEEEQIFQAYFYAEGLRDFMTFTDNNDRKSPVSLVFPKDLRYKVTINLPEDWPLVDDEYTIDRPEYYYQYKALGSADKKKFYIEHHYQTRAPEVAASDYSRLVRDHDKMLENMNYSLSFRDSKLAVGDSSGKNDLALMNIIFWIVRILALAIGLIGFIILHRRYDPRPKPEFLQTKGSSIGGWMLLPLIGLLFSPFFLIKSMYEAYDAEVISNLAFFLKTDSEYSNVGYVVFALFEHFVDIIRLLFVVLLVIQFFQQRSSLPILMVIWYAFSTIWEIFIEFSLVSYDLSTSYEAGKNLGRSFISILIWIPFFLVNRRVKETFTYTRKHYKLEDETLTEAGG